VLSVLGGQETLVHVVLETDAAFALARLAHLGALVALRVVVDFVLGLWTCGLISPAVGGLGALLGALTLHALRGLDKLAVVVATFSFAGRALNARLAGAPVQLVLRLRQARVRARMTTLFCAFMFVKTTVALFTLLHDFVPTKGSVALLQTISLPTVHHGVEDG